VLTLLISIFAPLPTDALRDLSLALWPERAGRPRRLTLPAVGGPRHVPPSVPSITGGAPVPRSWSPRDGPTAASSGHRLRDRPGSSGPARVSAQGRGAEPPPALFDAPGRRQLLRPGTGAEKVTVALGDTAGRTDPVTRPSASVLAAHDLVGLLGALRRGN
jgi:hypothetical protein